jgi:hypothetical protein
MWATDHQLREVVNRCENRLHRLSRSCSSSSLNIPTSQTSAVRHKHSYNADVYEIWSVKGQNSASLFVTGLFVVTEAAHMKGDAPELHV